MLQLVVSAVALLASSAPPVTGGTWSKVQNVPNIAANNPLLLTDGSVMVQDADSNHWWKLTPDIRGNYSTGIWKQLASTSSNWGPLYFGSEVMTDGRVFAIGGEYNFGAAVWTNQGGVYDPVQDKWTTITAPAPWTGMGDTATAVLPNGLVYIADPLTSETAAFNPATSQFIYPYGQSALQYNDEAGLTLLPNGNLYRADCWTDKTAEVFNTTTLTWTATPTMPYSVLDVPDAEMGPAILQYNGQVIQFGGNGANVIYDPATNAWISAPSFPTNSSGQIDVADGPAVLLPNGNVMVDAGPGYGAGASVWFIWNGSTLTQTQGPPAANFSVGFSGSFLLLPSGQVLFANQSSDLELFTPVGSASSTWAPVITNAPSDLRVGNSYTISGKQFNGLSQGSAYGDDLQGNTNYPMVRITFSSTGHVYYAREYNPSTMAICTGNAIVSTHFQVPLNIELGAAAIQVVTNGIASAPVSVEVLPPLAPYAVELFPGQGTNPNGNVASVSNIDGIYFTGNSQSTTLGQVCAVEADFSVGTGINYIKAFAYAYATPSATEQLFIYNYQTLTWVLVGAQPFGFGETGVSGAPTANSSQFVSPTGEVRVIVRAIVPNRSTPLSFTMGVDFVGLEFG